VKHNLRLDNRSNSKCIYSDPRYTSEIKRLSSIKSREYDLSDLPLHTAFKIPVHTHGRKMHSWTTAAGLNEGIHRRRLAHMLNSKSRFTCSVYCGAIKISTPSNLPSNQRAQAPQPLPRVLAPAAQASIRRLYSESLQSLTVAIGNRTNSGLQQTVPSAPLRLARCALDQPVTNVCYRSWMCKQ
jgi:hypothetical protein